MRNVKYQSIKCISANVLVTSGLILLGACKPDTKNVVENVLPEAQVFYDEIAKAAWSADESIIDYTLIPFDEIETYTPEIMETKLKVRIINFCKYDCANSVPFFRKHIKIFNVKSCDLKTSYVRKVYFKKSGRELAKFYVAQFGESILYKDTCYSLKKSPLEAFDNPFNIEP